MKYMGMATQLFLFMFVLLFIGKKIDAHFQFAKPYFTIFLPVIGLFIYLYKLVKDVSKKDG